MSNFTKALVVSPLADGRTWVLLEPFSYDVGFLGSKNTVEVPAGFMTDFASIPRPLWWLFPQWGKYGNAAVIHDYGYWTQSRKRSEVDRILLEGMNVLGVDWLGRHAIWLAVRLFGWVAWALDKRRARKGKSMYAATLPQRSTDTPETLRAA